MSFGSYFKVDFTKNSCLKLFCPICLHRIWFHEKRSWKRVTGLISKLTSRKIREIFFIQFDLNLISRKKSWSQVTDLISKLISLKILETELLCNVVKLHLSLLQIKGRKGKFKVLAWDLSLSLINIPVEIWEFSPAIFCKNSGKVTFSLMIYTVYRLTKKVVTQGVTSFQGGGVVYYGILINCLGF